MRLEKDARRQHFIDAAIRVFARGGYTKTDVAAVVAEAQVVRGTFYLYFQAKRDILLAIIDQYIELLQRQSALPPPPPGTPLRDQLAHAFAQVLTLHANHRELALVALRDGWGADPESAERLRAAGTRAKAALAAVYGQLMASGHLRPLDSQLVAAAIGGMLREVVLHEILLKEPPAPIEPLAESLATLVYHGLER